MKPFCHVKSTQTDALLLNYSRARRHPRFPPKNEKERGFHLI